MKLDYTCANCFEDIQLYEYMNASLTIEHSTQSFKCIAFTVFWLSIHLICNSQGEFNKWYFGNYAGLDFNLGSPVPLTNSNLLSVCAGITVSDSLGNLQFYSDGFRVLNKNHQTMPNGVGLHGGNGFRPNQTIFCVKDIVQDSLYYLFTMDWHDGNWTGTFYGLQYSVLDLRLNNGLGDIVTNQKNIPIPGGEDGLNALTGIRHSNNKDAWIVIRKQSNIPNNPYFASYLISSTGFNPIPVLSTSIIPLPNYYNTQLPHVIKICPEGNRLACLYDSIVEFCSFNATTGQITPFFKFGLPSVYSVYHSPWSLEFSNDSKYLYVTSALTN